MELIPLGVFVNRMPPGGCSSAYLVRSEKTCIAVDFGNGAAGQLARVASTAKLDGIIISHMHADHFLDLIPLAHALLSETMRTGQLIQIPLFLPVGGIRILRALCAVLGLDRYTFPNCCNHTFLKSVEETKNFVFSVFDIREAEDSIAIGDLSIQLRRMRHPAATNGMRISDGKGCLFFTADTAWFPGIVEYAEGADLLLCECTEGTSSEVSPIHLSAIQAAKIAMAANVKRLALTHFDTSCPMVESFQAASQLFPSTILAQQMISIPF